jgi:hypothetical protein
MVVMIGPPAAGKGYFLGEPEKDKGGQTKKYKTEKGEERETTFGYRLPKSTTGLFTDEDIPAIPDQDESDNHLRAIQFEESKGHYEDLVTAHKEGKESFDKALADIWYKTKDGERQDLSKYAKYEDFPKTDDPIEGHKAFLKKYNTDFYVSMRGWHNDVDEKNEETGKPKERYKDEARHRFDDKVRRMAEHDDASHMLIVDSAGEDIDTMDFKGQVEHAKAAGYQVSVIFLHPEKADTELSNLSRGKVMGKRMVDQSDIDNWYKKNEKALKSIQEADPDNFLHYRKGPPAHTPEEAEARRKQARDLMNKLSTMSEQEKGEAKTKINEILYGAAQYKLQKETSYGRTLKGLPKKPEKNIAEAVKAMNEDAEARAGGGSKKPEEKKDHDKSEKDNDSKTKSTFLDSMGEKEVPNPNFNSTHKESPSNPRSRKIRNLPWEHQKRYYEEWKKSKKASARDNIMMAARVVVRWKERVVMANQKGWLHGWMSKLAKELQAKVSVEGYEISAEAGEGPIVYVTVKGAEGDTTAFRKLKSSLDGVLKESINHEVRDEAFRSSVSMSSKGDDMLVTCEIIFPDT